jgi:hypothetical protein
MTLARVILLVAKLRRQHTAAVGARLRAPVFPCAAAGCCSKGGRVCRLTVDHSGVVALWAMREVELTARVRIV